MGKWNDDDNYMVEKTKKNLMEWKEKKDADGRDQFHALQIPRGNVGKDIANNT